jgi:hypothetical protein
MLYGYYEYRIVIAKHHHTILGDDDEYIITKAFFSLMVEIQLNLF